ncbi:hypothetical protein CBR_g31235 [Chara braunii]|uniref:RING-type domain-containing protein n=1 Tax=Chara braunii TaxID=69332 RepID=A0A388JXR1_CHABU|nr:hypothetical protein CBR_g31235 [Chara braunii]|eukprot:GBG62599.1 hypothetical protein CBR_g31235 [Chara braunii]
MGDESCRSEDCDLLLSAIYMHFHSMQELTQLPRQQGILHWLNDPRSRRGYAKADGFYTDHDRERMPTSIPVPRVEGLAVEEIDANLICCVCQNLLRDPIVLSPCAHVVGGPCVQYLHNNVCPRCQENITLGSEPIPARYAQERVLELRLNCPFGMSYDLDTRTYVSLRIVLESIQGIAPGQGDAFEGQLFCTEIIRYEDLQLHILECPFRPVRCSGNSYGCPAVIPQTGLIHALHMRSICPAREVDPCPRCGASLRFTEMESHNRTSCLGEIVHCDNENIGCPEMVSRGDLRAHMERCPYSSELVQRDLKRCYGRIEELKRENATLRETNNALRRENAALREANGAAEREDKEPRNERGAARRRAVAEY